MKLLSKTVLYSVIFSLLTFTAGGFIFYFNLRNQIIQEVDQSLDLEKNRIIQKLMFADTIPGFYTSFENQIEVVEVPASLRRADTYSDLLIYDSIEKDSIPFRRLDSYLHLYTREYHIGISKSLINKSELTGDIFLLMLFLFISLLMILLLVNVQISRRMLRPFYKTLENVKTYMITRGEGLNLPKTPTTEFTMLNNVLNRMSAKISKDFISLKEFTENASHEMQTPLAVIRSKLELLIQHENLTEDEIRLIQSISDSANKLSRMSRALVLITRIDNQQFSDIENVNITDILNNQLENLEELITEKKITVSRDLQNEICAKMNPALAEIMLTNLLSNAIKHNIPGGSIHISTRGRVFSITNTGLHSDIEPSELFGRFRKGSQHPDSIGLGLSIVKKIADTHKIAVAYTTGEGTHTLTLTFSVTGSLSEIL